MRTKKPIKNTRPTTFQLKLALLEYFRFKRQSIVVDECCNNDIVADTGKEIIEVEVKISKSDLIYGERTRSKQIKHKKYANSMVVFNPNKYYFCVPSFLKNNTIEYAKNLNPNYGVIVFNENNFFNTKYNRKARAYHMDYLEFVKKAKNLHQNYHILYQKQIAKRCSAKLITLLQDKAKNEN